MRRRRAVAAAFAAFLVVATGSTGAPRARAVLGTADVRRPGAPLLLAWPTSVAVDAAGKLLVVENGTGRLLRVDPASGRTTVVARVDRAYAVARAPSGAVYLSAGRSLLRVGTGGRTSRVAQADDQIGPVAVTANGDVYYTTATGAFRVRAGGAPVRVARGFASPHGLAVTRDGGLLVSDTDHGRVVRVEPSTGRIERWGDLRTPRGIVIAPDGTVYVVDAGTKRVVHLTIDGRRLPSPAHAFSDPYALAVTAGGSVVVADTAASGRLVELRPDGTASVVSRR